MEFFVDSKATLDSALKNLKSGDVLHLKSGIYRTKIKINFSNITIIGEGNNTIICNKDYFNKINEIDNKEYLTVRTYTVLIAGDNVKLKNLTIQNESVPSSVYGQAVALEVLGDNFEATNVRLLGAQDTLLCGPIPYDLTIRYKDLLPKDELIFKKSRQYYNNCYIEGDTDFIFGSGIAYFKNC
jgi:pectinesterase